MAAMGVCLIAAGASADEIPVDGNGRPLWQKRIFNDAPVRMELSGTKALRRLLSNVPIASFNRDQITPTPTGLTFEPRVTAAEARALRAHGYALERLGDRHQASRRAMEEAWADQARRGKSTSGEKGVYHTPTQVGDILLQVAADHPTIAKAFTIGTSVQGREIWAVVISDNVGAEEAEPEVRLSSTIHGDEPVGLEMLLYLVDHLTDNYASDPDVKALVDDYEIHLIPCHNPDGVVAGTRVNAHNIDLNRNFPVMYPETPEPETTLFVDYGNAHNFVVSGNCHGGALVVNYPYDYTPELAPDDATIIALSLEYSTYNPPMFNGSFTKGITNGYAWYGIDGSLQDWSYESSGCIDVTLELSDDKIPPTTDLEALWADNRESFLHYLRAARYGINGVVSAADTGLPLSASVTVLGNAKPVVTDPDRGDYYKLLGTGTYDIQVSSFGYNDATLYGLEVIWGQATVRDVALVPLADGEVAGLVTTTAGDGIAAQVEVRVLQTQELVAALSTNPISGAYATTLPHGDYVLLASSAGFIPAEAQVTIAATPAEHDFALVEARVETLVFDDVEGSLALWTGGWGKAIPSEGYLSGNSLTDSPGSGVGYAAEQTNPYLLNTVLDLSGATDARVSFWAKWSIENGYDGCMVQVSPDAGTTWENLTTAFTRSASGEGVQQPAGVPVFDGWQPTWVENVANLGPWLGEPELRLRFVLVSDQSIEGDGFTFDDFEVVIVRPAVIGPDGNADDGNQQPADGGPQQQADEDPQQLADGGPQHQPGGDEAMANPGDAVLWMPDGPDGDPLPGCGCTSSPGGSAWLSVLLLSLIGCVRRSSKTGPADH